MEDTIRKAPSIQEYKDMLKKHGLKSTDQRLAVHRAMLRLGHASVDMIQESVIAEGITRITAASAYNILSQMTGLGIYSTRMSTNSKMYFDVNSFDHIHLYDTVNNTYKDIIDDELMEIIREHLGNKRFRGFTIQGFDVHIKCRPTRSKSRIR